MESSSRRPGPWPTIDFQAGTINNDSQFEVIDRLVLICDWDEGERSAGNQDLMSVIFTRK